MSSSSIQFHEKSGSISARPTEGIRESFGLTNALDYLIGEKLSISFRLQNTPSCQRSTGVCRRNLVIFAADEISEYLRQLEQTKFLAPLDVDWKSMSSTSSMSWTKSLGQKTLSEAQKSSCVSAVYSNCCKHHDSPSGSPACRATLLNIPGRAIRFG